MAAFKDFPYVYYTHNAEGAGQVKNYMHDTPIDKDLRDLHEALIDLVGLFNQPQRDSILIKEAGVKIDRALFPLLVRIERRGPLGIVELAEIAGRDYTTVSRQVTKLEGLGLVTRQSNAEDARVSRVTITKTGQNISDALDAARARLARGVFSKWSSLDKKNLVRLLRRFVDDFSSQPKGQ
jgi:DNA-binding MarR family transcriptional regulator